MADPARSDVASSAPSVSWQEIEDRLSEPAEPDSASTLHIGWVANVPPPNSMRMEARVTGGRSRYAKSVASDAFVHVRRVLPSV